VIDESDGLRAMRQSVETIEAELRNIHDEPMIGFLVVWDGRLWLRKPNGTWPEVLGCRLGQSWLNVAETVAGSEASGATDLNGAPIETAGGPPLVRVGQTSAVDGLPIRDLDEAIASELAFSLWTRRRDAGAWNRVYLEGVPVFFDHHIAFGTEDDHRSLDGFFKRGSNGGHASQWRLKRLENGEVPTTMGERALPREHGVHRIRSADEFERHLDRAIEKIQGISDAELRAAVSLSDAPAWVSPLLTEWRDELPLAVQRLREVIQSD